VAKDALVVTVAEPVHPVQTLRSGLAPSIP
jgi:hypothetical protein